MQTIMIEVIKKLKVREREGKIPRSDICLKQITDKNLIPLDRYAHIKKSSLSSLMLLLERKEFSYQIPSNLSQFSWFIHH